MTLRFDTPELKGKEFLYDLNPRRYCYFENVISAHLGNFIWIRNDNNIRLEWYTSNLHYGSKILVHLAEEVTNANIVVLSCMKSIRWIEVRWCSKKDVDISPH